MKFGIKKSNNNQPKEEKKAFEVNEEAKNVDVNKKKAEEFENLMEKSSTDLDLYYYDSKNPLVRLLLIILGLIIIVGCAVIFGLWYFIG